MVDDVLNTAGQQENQDNFNERQNGNESMYKGLAKYGSDDVLGNTGQQLSIEDEGILNEQIGTKCMNQNSVIVRFMFFDLRAENPY